LGLQEIVVPQIKSKKEVAVRKPRRTVVGVVTSDKMQKTIAVRVERLVKHPVFEKTLRLSDTCYAHDEKREAKCGDRVELMESRPLSRKKNWRLVRVVQKAAEPVRDAREAARPAKPDDAPAADPPSGPAV
jgi:small subunit ribosomal protein S17